MSAATQPAARPAMPAPRAPWSTQRAALFTSGSPEWYTPAALAREIAAFLGGIDLDPCADPARSIPAKRHLRESGLTARWRGRVFLNPPYGRQIGSWTRKALSEPVEELVLLVPARTDTAWFQPLYEHTLCFIRGRLRFSGASTGAPFPSALVYRGARHWQFAHAFAHRGAIVTSLALPRPALWALPPAGSEEEQ